MKWVLIFIFTNQFKQVPAKQHAGIALDNWCPWVEVTQNRTPRGVFGELLCDAGA